MAARTSKYSADQIENMKKMRKKGATIKEIATKYSCASSTVCRLLGNTSARKKVTKKKGKRKKRANGVPAQRKNEVSKLKAELAYKSWCLEGERSGYVDRLLSELGK
jgi:hypothetical protein